MRPVVMALFAVLTLLIAPFFASATSDLGNPNVTRLWAASPKGDQFVCTGWYGRSPRDNSTMDRASFLFTAGHCGLADYAYRSPDEYVVAMINWQVVITAGSGSGNLALRDFAVATVPDWRGDLKNRGFWLGEELPDSGSVYIHGFPAGIETVTRADIVPKHISYSKDVPTGPSRFALAPRGSVKGGSSGSPVLTQTGRAVGIVWGIIDPSSVYPNVFDKDDDKEYVLVILSPIEDILDFFRKVDRKAE